VVTVPGPGVTHLDPETGMVEKPVAFDCIASALRSDIVVGSGAVWVVMGGDCGVVKVNPATDEEGRAVPIPTASGDDVDARIAAGIGKIWILGSGGLSRVDPFLARVEQTADRIDGDDIAVGDRAVWIADGLRKSVVRVDPDTLEAVDTFELQASPDQLALGEDRIWVLNTEAGTVIPVGYADGDVGDPIRVGSDPMSIDAGFGFVWVVSHGDGTVIRIDPETRRTTTIDVGGPPTSLAIDPETKTVWVAISRCIGPGCRL
jgi:streptogramin lyase